MESLSSIESQGDIPPKPLNREPHCIPATGGRSDHQAVCLELRYRTHDMFDLLASEKNAGWLVRVFERPHDVTSPAASECDKRCSAGLCLGKCDAKVFATSEHKGLRMGNGPNILAAGQIARERYIGSSERAQGRRLLALAKYEKSP